MSLLGSRATSIAYPMLALYLTSSPLKAGWVACAAIAPSVIVYLPAGVLVDRWDPRRVMIVSEFNRGAVVTVIVVAVALGKPSIWLLVGCAISESVLEAFSSLAERCYVRLLVEPDQLPSAQVQMEVRAHAVVLAGRPLGGFLFGLRPIAPFLFDALSFAISVIVVLSINKMSLTWRTVGVKYQVLKSIIKTGWPSDVRLRHNLGDALRWLVKEPYAFSMVAISVSATLVFQALVMITLADAHAQSAAPMAIGIVLGASGAGGAVGSILFRARPTKLGQFGWIRFQTWFWLATFGILALLDGRWLPVTAILMALLGLTGALGNIELNTYLAQRVDNGMLARVTSFVRIMTLSACAIGSALGGLLAQITVTGAPWILFVLTAIVPPLSFHAPPPAPGADEPRLSATSASSQ